MKWRVSFCGGTWTVKAEDLTTAVEKAKDLAYENYDIVDADCITILNPTTKVGWEMAVKRYLKDIHISAPKEMPAGYVADMCFCG
jgi:hypothetical protein